MGFKRVEAPWILAVAFSSSVLEKVEKKIDIASGEIPSIQQCWGRTIGTDMVFLYSYFKMEEAMEASNRVEKVRGVSEVDVYDIEYPPDRWTSVHPL